MSADRTLSWHRRVVQGKADGYEAVDLLGGWVKYIVRRDPDAPAGRQWTLTYTTATIPEPGDRTRTGFDQMSTAQVAALNTRCHLCHRVLPFATLEPSGSNGGWRCRNRAECDQAAAERKELAHSTYQKIRDTGKEEIFIRDTEDGPELVLTTAGTGARQVVQCTERDLTQIALVVLTRLLAKTGREPRS